MREFKARFQEIHRDCYRTFLAEDMDDAEQKAEAMLPEIIRLRKWNADHTHVAEIRDESLCRTK